MQADFQVTLKFNFPIMLKIVRNIDVTIKIRICVSYYNYKFISREGVDNPLILYHL